MYLISHYSKFFLLKIFGHSLKACLGLVITKRATERRMLYIIFKDRKTTTSIRIKTKVKKTEMELKTISDITSRSNGGHGLGKNLEEDHRQGGKKKGFARFS